MHKTMFLSGICPIYCQVKTCVSQPLLIPHHLVFFPRLTANRIYISVIIHVHPKGNSPSADIHFQTLISKNTLTVDFANRY